MSSGKPSSLKSASPNTYEYLSTKYLGICLDLDHIGMEWNWSNALRCVATEIETERAELSLIKSVGMEQNSERNAPAAAAAAVSRERCSRMNSRTNEQTQLPCLLILTLK